MFFWFAANDTSGSGGDGASPLFDVREAGAAANAVSLLSGTPALLSHANFPAGCHEVSVAATGANGFAANDTFAVFCTLAVDSQNPTGFIGSCTLTPLAKVAALQAVKDETVLIVADTAELQSDDTPLAIAALQTDLDTLTAGVTLAADAITSAKIADNAFLAVNFAANAIDAAALSADAVAEIADGVWDELLAGHTTADTAGLLLNDWQDGGRLDVIQDIIAADTTTDIPSLINALNDISEANVLTQINAALDTAIPQLSAGVPAATPTLRTGLMFIYMGLRNKRATTSNSDEIHNDAGGVIATAVLSDDNVTFIKAEYA